MEALAIADGGVEPEELGDGDADGGEGEGGAEPGEVGTFCSGGLAGWIDERDGWRWCESVMYARGWVEVV